MEVSFPSTLIFVGVASLSAIIVTVGIVAVFPLLIVTFPPEWMARFEAETLQSNSSEEVIEGSAIAVGL